MAGLTSQTTSGETGELLWLSSGRETWNSCAWMDHPLDVIYNLLLFVQFPFWSPVPPLIRDAGVARKVYRGSGAALPRKE